MRCEDTYVPLRWLYVGISRHCKESLWESAYVGDSRLRGNTTQAVLLLLCTRRKYVHVPLRKPYSKNRRYCDKRLWRSAYIADEHLHGDITQGVLLLVCAQRKPLWLPGSSKTTLN